MGNIYCLIGKSSTGKDTIYKLLLNREDLNLKRIVSYTTRPIREGELPGEEYNFVSLDERERLIDEGKVIEMRKYDTMFGPWYYFTVDDGQVDLENHDYLIIGTVASYLKLREFYGENIKPIYIEVDDGLRLERALKRERKQKEPKYEEMCRRFLADAVDFSKDKLKEAGIDNIFNNDEDREDTTERIALFIKHTKG